MKGRRLALILGLAGGLAGCVEEPLVDGIFTEAEWALIQTLSPLPELPPDPTNAYADDPMAAALGHRLFFDTSFAGPLAVGEQDGNGGLGAPGERGKVSCNSCHMASAGWFVDLRSQPAGTSLAAGWGHRNTPPVVNVAFHTWFSWAGESDSLWKQSLGTTEAAVSMNSTRLAVAHTLHDSYRDEYEAVFGPIDPRFDPAHPRAADFPPAGKPGQEAFDFMEPADQDLVNRMFANYGKALAAYERLLISRDAPFDRYVAGDTTAMSLSAKRGLELFIGKAGCVDCHKTPLFSDNRFHNIGVPQEGPHASGVDEGQRESLAHLLQSPFNSRGPYSDDPQIGRLDGLEVAERQAGRFRTPQLRQVAETAPYMHTGAFHTLEEVIEHYDDGGHAHGYVGALSPRIQRLGLAPDEIDDLVAFLRSLTGELVDEALRQPPP